MNFNVTKEQWVERFVQRLAILRTGGVPDEFVETANRLWPAHGQVDPVVAADSEFASGGASPGSPADAFEKTQHDFDQPRAFETTERIPVERIQTAGEYVRDTSEWIARCVGRVLQLDPIIKADEARRSVTDLAELERWRLMKPEAAAEQLYTPIKPRAA